jgi:hypothetical protein
MSARLGGYLALGVGAPRLHRVSAAVGPYLQPFFQVTHALRNVVEASLWPGRRGLRCETIRLRERGGLFQAQGLPEQSCS